jgi:hypothetical protein
MDSWPEMEKWLLALEKEQHEYQVVAIDTIDWLLRRVEEHVAGSAGKLEQTLNRSHGGYGNGKQVLKNYIYRCLLPMLDRITARGVAVILLAHAHRTEITDVDGITVEKTTPDIPQDYLNIIVEWSDFVCLARLDGDQRRMVTEDNNLALAKNRYGMPPVIDFTWKAFTAAVAAGLSKKLAATKGSK